MTMLVAGGRLVGSDAFDETPIISATAALSNGGFAFVTTSSVTQKVTILDASGFPVGDPIQFSSTGVEPGIVGLGDGGFAVVWTEIGGSPRVMARIYGADGSPTGTGFAVSDNVAGSHNAVAVLPSGDLVVSWQQGNGASIGVRVVGVDGTLRTSTALISPGLQVGSVDPIVLADGRTLIAYDAYAGPTGNSAEIKVALFDSTSGTVTNGNFITLNQASGSHATDTHVTQLASGKILLTWLEYPSVGTPPYTFHGELFDANGADLSQGFTASVSPGATGIPETVTALPNGGFAIAYEGGSAQDYDIFGQLYDDNAGALGPSFVISNPNEAAPNTPHLVAFGTNDLAAIWSYMSGAGTDASMRLYYGTIQGSSAGETIDGTAGDDVILGLNGDDVLNGLAGGDLLIGGAGADTLSGGEGLDSVDYSDSASGVTINLATGLGSGGDAEGDHFNSIEIVVGSAFADTLVGDANANRLDGGDGDDLLAGGAGVDLLVGGNGVDTVDYGASSIGVTVNLTTGFGSGGDAEGDILQGIERIIGSAFADTLTGDGNANRLDGGSGDDVLVGGAGADTLIGGAGIDLASYAASSAGVTVNLSTGTGTGGDAAGDTLSGIENLRGSASSDSLTGDANANTLEGLDGSDILSGGDGNDRLIGGAGNDTLIGGNGNDVAVIAASSAGISVAVMANGDIRLISDDGIDTLRGIEQVEFSDRTLAIAALAAIGTPGAEDLTATANGDFLAGLGGDDTLHSGTFTDVTLDGGLGNDVFYVGDASIVVLERPDEGNDTVIASIAFSAPDNVETLVLASGADAVLTANDAGTILIGNELDNVLYGAAGDDTLTGGLGSDTLVGGAGADIFRDTAAGHDGDLIVDMAVGDRITITDANFATFSFALHGQTLTYTGGSLRFAELPTGQLYAAANGAGGVDILVRPANVQHDFDGDGQSDILWRSAGGLVGNWLATTNGNFAPNPNILGVSTDWKIAGTGDFNGDGMSDLLWRNDNGQFGDWLASGGGDFTPNATLYGASTDWKIVGTGDFDGDGKTDLLWRNDSGTFGTWSATADGTGFTPNATLYGVTTDWKIAGTGDFDGNGTSDILWRNTTTGQFGDWLSNGDGTFAPNATLGASPLDWHIAETGDFNGDGKTDILWRSDAGQVGTWFAGDGGNFTPNATLYGAPTDWKIVEVGDFNGDAKDDILWRNVNSGQLGDWISGGDGSFAPNANLYAAPLDWNVAGDHTFLV